MISIKSTLTESILEGTSIVGMVILIGGSADSSVILDDSTDGTGTEKIELKALTNDSKIAFFGNTTGISFSTGIYSTISGTGAKVFIYLK